MESGVIVSAPTLKELATKTGLPADAFRATVERFNGFARTGVDEDFKRGESAYDRYYGDPLVRPNPNLGPIEKGPYTAVRVVPGDLGTKGGVVTDADARVLRADGSVIEGLYAAGNAGGSFFGYYCPVSGFSAAGVSHALVGGPLAAASALGKTLDDLPKA